MGVLEPLLECVCEPLCGRACVHIQDANYLFPTEPSGTFSVYYPSKGIALSQGPFGAFDPELGEAGKKKTRAGRRGNCPLLCLRSLDILGSRLCLSELPLTGPKRHHCHPQQRQTLLSLPLVTSHPSIFHNSGPPEMLLPCA